MACQRHPDDHALDFRPAKSREEADPGGVATGSGTGSTWNILGRCVHGPLTGRRLQPVPFSFDKPFWFARAAYHPGTRLRSTAEELHEPAAAAG